MAKGLGRVDRLLLVTLLPIGLLCQALHVHEVARSGLAQLPVYAAPSAGGSPYPDVGGYRLETDSGGTELLPGDRLVRVGGRDLAGVGYLGFDVIGLAEAGTAGAPLVYERDGVRRTTTLRAEPHPHPWTRLPATLLIPVAVLVLLRGSADGRRFFLAFMAYTTVQAQFYGGPEWKSWASLWIWNLGTPLAVVLMLRWTAFCPEELPPERRAWWGWPWLAGALWVALRVNFFTGWPIPPAQVQPVSHVLHALMMLGAIALLARNFYHADSVGRRRVKWILYGAAVGSTPLIATQLTTLVAPDWQHFELGFALSTLATVVWILCLMIAVVRFNAFDIDRLIGSTAAYSAVAIALGGALLWAVPALADRGAALFRIDPQTTRLALAMGLAALALPAARRMRPRVDALFFPERLALERGIDALLEELSRSDSAEALLRRVSGGVTALLRPRGHALFLSLGGELRRLAGDGLEAPELLLAPLRARLAPLSRPTELVLHEGDERRVLALPLHRESELVALLCLGPKRSGDVYTATDRTLLAAVAQRASGELERFRIAESMREERRRALTLASQKEEADRASASKSRLLAAASHDIRQPLHALGLLVESLAGRVDEGEARELAEKIRLSTHDLGATLETLLDLSRLEAGAVKAQVTSFPLDRVLEQIESEFSEEAARKGLRLRVRRCGLAVRSDRLLLTRILRNLVSNAIRYTRRGGVLVGVRRGADRLRLQVVDTGRGISEAEQRLVFQEFRRLAEDRPDDGGHGLGLAIVEGLAAVLGHETGLRSTPGRGSVFELGLPRAPQAAAAPVEPVRPQVGPAALQGRRIGVVDDDRAVCEATGSLLRDWGCEVRTAGSVEEAWDRLGAGDWQPDFVLSDQHLGGPATGAELIAGLRRRVGDELPAALITADTSPERVRALRDTGLPVLRKPLAPARLRALLTELLGRRVAGEVAAPGR